ncbi:hypothetical protein ACSLBF_16990 [Pseudoalteromonas sp. T1lg65]|uniref:hypothetical protein n=1 Tax=Pseudoalteromonas sp. T1lg65 TaxID=2077101 RepID=UPI003F7922B3
MNSARKTQSIVNYEVVLRILIVVLVGYPLAMMIAIVISQLLPLSKPDSVAAASFLSFAVYTAYIMWAFAQKAWQRVLRVSCLLLLVSSALHLAIDWLMGAI